MKTILFTIAIALLSNLSFSQSTIGYKYNYEIKFDQTHFENKEPRNTVRNFVDFIFQSQNQKFNVKTRYSQEGVLYISTDTIINECTVEAFFHAQNSELLSFEQKPQETRKSQSDSTVAEN